MNRNEERMSNARIGTITVEAKITFVVPVDELVDLKDRTWPYAEDRPWVGPVDAKSEDAAWAAIEQVTKEWSRRDVTRLMSIYAGRVDEWDIEGFEWEEVTP